ncbi:PhaM family polyhydroxyalkanoate granule multifunctional regulatory protein [Glaciimonas immobilis]|uniref:Tfp pilus assembly protein FimV n=1 Tax=Glaciimonas immobilis TaxID=728004 RepID=A0A840S169_9BURK|nr:PhaM family polyhydroxyalkanoate granule multifunctional regulatory protein [Glaciimonas immobilis]KAF3997325.1 pilus assembly protein FimV [Glaciimonas immobilis]MBB5202370.1 hypothetical protein [Glaciimonas immobilis]
MSNPNFLGTDAMTNSVDFIKKMWGGMGVPGMVVPILSVEEIDKKVTDLKAVEGWLSLNLNMLRTTIQALEVQSATLSALKSIGALAMPSADAPQTPKFGETATESMTEGAAAWATMASQFPFSFMPDKANNANESVPEPAVAPIYQPTSAPEPVAAAAPAPDTSVTDAMANTGAWWDVLQNQFKQVVSGVMANEATGGASASGEKSVPKAKGSPSRSTGTGTPTKSKAKPKPKASAMTGAKSVAAIKATRKPAATKTPASARSKKVPSK